MDLTSENLQVILGYLDKIGAKIGITGETIWPWLVRQKYIEFYMSSVTFVFGIILSSIMLCLISKYHPFNDDEYDDRWPTSRILLVSFTVVGVLAFVIGFIATLCTLPGVLNPEYWAFKDLMEMLRGPVH